MMAHPNFDTSALIGISSTPVGQAMLTLFANRARDRKELTVERVVQSLKGERIRCSQAEVRDVFKALEAANLGRFIIGRRGRKSRFEWSVPMTTVGQIAAAELGPATEAPVERRSRPRDARRKSFRAKKKCQYCAESIQAEAVYCRYCHRDVDNAAMPIRAEPTQELDAPSRGRPGRFTYFPDKSITRSWRITAKTDDLLRDAGERIIDTSRSSRGVGAADVIETLATLYAGSLTLEDILRASAARLQTSSE